MLKNIPFLQAGDKIRLVAPAKAIDPVLVDEAKDFWEKQGFEVVVGKNTKGSFHYFSGKIEERLTDFQEALDDLDAKAIICVRGGYGCVQLVDLINWSSFILKPKWIVGFSDVTVFHQRIQRYGFPSIHGTMPLNYKQNSSEALKTMTNVLVGELRDIKINSQSINKIGNAKGNLLGGNLSIVYSLLGTDDQPDYQDSILFLEDLCEQLYHIDRMFFALQKAGIINQISGLIIGGFTDLKDVDGGFGKTLEQIILDHCAYRNIPIAFGFPAGHIDDNRALILGQEVELTVNFEETVLRF
jgi:muramoyltetrapeptide carboxypeptidase